MRTGTNGQLATALAVLLGISSASRSQPASFVGTYECRAFPDAGASLAFAIRDATRYVMVDLHPKLHQVMRSGDFTIDHRTGQPLSLLWTNGPLQSNWDVGVYFPPTNRAAAKIFLENTRREVEVALTCVRISS